MALPLNSKALQDPGPEPGAVVPSGPGAAAKKFGSAPPMYRPSGIAEEDPLRRLAFRSGLGMIFLRIAVIPDILYFLLHTNTYLLYLVGPPAILGSLFSGSLGRTFKHPAAWLWLGFFACMILAVPFSSWLGGSFGEVQGFALFSFPMLLVAGGLTMMWREVRALFSTMAVAGVSVIVASKLMATEDNGRLDMSGTSLSIGNSNDLASHLILVLPFLLYVLMDKKRKMVLRLSTIPVAGYALWVIFGTASRGALVALFVTFLFAMARANATQRVAAVVVAVLLASTVPFFLGENARNRLGSLFGDHHQEAEESGESRIYLFKKSIEFTLERPIFGVGPGQFPNYEGKQAVYAGVRGNWHATHNAITQISSECGIPAAIFFVLAMVSVCRSVSRVYRQARREANHEVANACFCYLLCMTGYLTSIMFLANGYRFYLSTMIGIGIALTSTAEREMLKNPPASRKQPNPFPGYALMKARTGNGARAPEGRGVS